MLKNLFFFIGFILSIPTFAQSNKDTNQQLIYTYLYSKQYDKAKDLINSKFLTSVNSTQKIIGYVYLADYYGETNEEKKRVEALTNAQKIVDQSKQISHKAYLNFGYSRYYLKIKQNELFVKNLNEAIKTFSTLPEEDFILTQLYFLKYNFTTKNNPDFDDKIDVINANKHALKSKNPLLINFTYNNLGYYYKTKYNNTKQNKFIDSAEYAYQKAFDYANHILDPITKDRSLIVYNLNKSSLEEIKSSDNQSINVLKFSTNALKIANKKDSYNDLKSFIYNNIGSYYTINGQHNIAKKHYQTAYNLVENNPDLINYKIKFLSNLAHNAESSNNLEEAVKYLKEEKNLILQNNTEQTEKNIQALEIFYQTEQANLKIKQLNETNKYIKNQMILYICFILIAIIIFIFLIYNYQIKRKINSQKQIIKYLENSTTS